MFQLTKEEDQKLRFQVETTNNMSRTLPYVFTEPKTFSINILEDEEIKKTLINKIKTIKRNNWQTSKEVIK